MNKELLEELRLILKEEFGLEFQGKEVEDFAYSLVEYFDLLEKIRIRKPSSPPY